MNPFSRRDWKRKARSTWQKEPVEKQQELPTYLAFIILAVIVIMALLLRSCS